jgi:hypothetical protein
VGAVAKHLLDVRTAVSGVVAGLVLAGPLLGWGVLEYQLSSVVADLMRDPVQERVDALALALPETGQSAYGGDRLIVSVASERVWVDHDDVASRSSMKEGLIWPLFERLDGEAQRQEELRHGLGDVAVDVQLLADRGETWAALSPVMRSAAAAKMSRVRLVSQGPDGRGGPVVTIRGAAHATAGTRQLPKPAVEHAMPDRFIELLLEKPPSEEQAPPPRVSMALQRAGAGTLDVDGELRTFASIEALSDAAGRLSDEMPGAIIELAPAGDVSLQGLVSAVDALQGDDWQPRFEGVSLTPVP